MSIRCAKTIQEHVYTFICDENKYCGVLDYVDQHEDEFLSINDVIGMILYGFTGATEINATDESDIWETGNNILHELFAWFIDLEFEPTDERFVKYIEECKYDYENEYRDLEPARRMKHILAVKYAELKAIADEENEND